jgi:cysteine desulfurase / selenocysteine lyase
MKPADLRAQIPILGSVTYLDSACMTLRPEPVIAAIERYYREHPACAGRSAHALARTTTQMVDAVRAQAKRFFGVKRGEVLFTKNASEALNLVARSVQLVAGDEVIISAAEHNSNLVPWLVRRDRDDIVVRIAEHDAHERIDVDLLENLITHRTRIIAIVGRSNVLGVRNDLERIGRIAHSNDVLFIVDGCQMALSDEIAITKMGIDGFAFSAHKMLGPSGLGGLAFSERLFERLDPFLVGGDTVESTTYDSYALASGHRRFEAGLQNYAGIAGFGEAMRIISSIGTRAIHAHEARLTAQLQDHLPRGLTILGSHDPQLRGSITCLTHGSLSSHEIAQILDHGFSIAVRSGRHCVHSWFEARGIEGSVRVSFGPYSNADDVEKLIEALASL